MLHKNTFELLELDDNHRSYDVLNFPLEQFVVSYFMLDERYPSCFRVDFNDSFM